MALGDTVCGHGGGGLKVGFDYILVAFFQLGKGELDLSSLHQEHRTQAQPVRSTIPELRAQSASPTLTGDCAVIPQDCRFLEVEVSCAGAICLLV